MPNLDLDAARAARAEATREPKTFTLGGETFSLPVEFPMSVAALWAENDYDGGMRRLLADAYERFAALDISAEDVTALVQGMAEMYGFNAPGESPASVTSSLNGSRRSRRTSRAATA